jgi:hypothetical protein
MVVACKATGFLKMVKACCRMLQVTSILVGVFEGMVDRAGDRFHYSGEVKHFLLGCLFVQRTFWVHSNVEKSWDIRCCK